jgi:ABC-type transport system involved in cytochrome bd biosynthesis fused ATPase/permease subunit
MTALILKGTSQEGKVIQYGNHAALSQVEGLYKSLCERQQNDPVSIETAE